MLRARSLWSSLLLAAILGAPAAAAEWIIEGRVVRITDGDSIKVLDGANVQHKIRLAAIDAPQSGQPFGARSRESLSRLVFDRSVTARCRKRHREREVCKITCGALDINLEQIRAGMAWWYREYAKEQTEEDRLPYAAAERQAHRRRTGLRGDAVPLPPWEWRKSERSAQARAVTFPSP
jgi:endonuclease YncB( thermonuclease family)